MIEENLRNNDDKQLAAEFEAKVQLEGPVVSKEGEDDSAQVVNEAQGGRKGGRKRNRKNKE